MTSNPGRKLRKNTLRAYRDNYDSWSRTCRTKGIDAAGPAPEKPRIRISLPPKPKFPRHWSRKRKKRELASWMLENRFVA